MIAIAIILGLSAIFISGLIVFWRKIVEWIKKATNKIKEVLGIAVQGVRTFIVKTTEGLKNRSRYYYEDKATKEWQEVVYTQKVDESQVPSDILAKVKRKNIDEEVSTTEELKLELTA